MKSVSRAALAVALPVLLWGAAGCGDTTLLDPMERQPKVRPFSANAHFEDGRGMRTPPANTVPRERIVGNMALTTGRDGDQDVKKIPLPVTRELIEKGHKRFDIVCAACHGVLGDGDSAAGNNMSLRPPPSLHERRELTNGHIFQVITSGYGLMPSYAYVLTPEERWAVIAYVRALQISQGSRADQLPADVRSQLEAKP